MMLVSIEDLKMFDESSHPKRPEPDTVEADAGPEALPMNNESPSSLALTTIMGNSKNGVDQFFQHVWQNTCVLYSIDRDKFSGDGSFKNRGRTIPETGWQQLVLSDWTPQNCPAQMICDKWNIWYNTFIFPKSTTRGPHRVQPNLIHAYLDGCSIVLNHADELCPYLATLCSILQLSFPHAYVNTYVTPTQSQAVPPHADDQDVFVIQVYGEKEWKVYRNIPIPYPYPHEPIGKYGREIPPSILKEENIFTYIGRRSKGWGVGSLTLHKVIDEKDTHGVVGSYVDSDATEITAIRIGKVDQSRKVHLDNIVNTRRP